MQTVHSITLITQNTPET